MDQIEATRLLTHHADGDKAASERLAPLVYDELRRLAAHYFRGEREAHTLQPTALVHEAYLRLFDQARLDWQGRTHYFALAAETMRRVLVDHARSRDAQKRGGGRQRVTLDASLALSTTPVVDVLPVHVALEKLAHLNARQAQVVEMRFFGGLTLEEIAEHLDVTVRTVSNDWKFARVWLLHELGRSDDGDPAT